MKIFISQPMRGYTQAEIIAERKRIESIFSGNEIIDSIIAEEPPKDSKEAVWDLGKSIELLSQADMIVCPRNYHEYNGCCIEREVAARYGIMVCNLDMYPNAERTSCGICVAEGA